jgi:Ca2+-binding EF-hand superfamily protein
VQTLNANAGGSFSQLSSTSSLISQANNLMQSIESTNNGNTTESEFEDFFTADGGTTSEADKDFAALDTSGTASLNSSDFTSALENLETNSDNSSPALTLLSAMAQNASSGGSSTT